MWAFVCMFKFTSRLGQGGQWGHTGMSGHPTRLLRGHWANGSQGCYTQKASVPCPPTLALILASPWKSSCQRLARGWAQERCSMKAVDRLFTGLGHTHV